MKFSKQKGFTLIELLVVVAIIGVLSTIIISSLRESQARARDAQRELDIKNIQTAFENYHLEHGNYPYGTGNNYYSANSSWADLETIMGIQLPTDPLNEYVNPYSGGYGYAYYVGPETALCSGQAYMLVYNKETANGDLASEPNDGVTFCNGTYYEFGNTFVVGMDRNGRLN